MKMGLLISPKKILPSKNPKVNNGIVTIFVKGSGVVTTIEFEPGMARDGSLPNKLGLIHHKTKIPWLQLFFYLLHRQDFL